MKLSESAFSSLNPQFKLNYESVGSGVGVENLKQKKDIYDFTLSESPLDEEDYINDPSFQVIPFQVGSISIVANIPELLKKHLRLRLTQRTLSQIFNHTITHWNDIRITSLNPSISLPAQPIRRIVRAGISGTTYDFTSGLHHFDRTWTTISRNMTWPNQYSDPYFLCVEGFKISSEIIDVDYSISYLQDEKTGCSITKYEVEIENAEGNFVISNTTTTSAAVDAIGVEFDSRFTADFLNPKGFLSYPINSVTYFIYRSKTNSTDCSRQIALYHFAKTFFFSTHGNAIVRATLKEPLAVHSSIFLKMNDVFSKMECSGKPIQDFFVKSDHNPIIIGAISGFITPPFLTSAKTFSSHGEETIEISMYFAQKTIKTISPKYYSTKSHLTGALYTNIFLIEAFKDSLNEISKNSNEYLKNPTSIEHYENLQTSLNLFSVCLHSHSKMESLGYSSIINSTLPANISKKFKKMHILESQKLHHIQHLIKELKKFHHSKNKSKKFLKQIDGEISSLKSILEQHFDDREEVFLPTLKELVPEEDLLKIQLKSIQKLKEQEDNLPLKLAFERNSMALCEKLIEEISTLSTENAKEIIEEIQIPQNVKDELVKRNEKFQKILI
eukprot:gene3154-5470_t